MATVTLTEKTQAFLLETFPDEEDLDTTVRQLIEAEYLRRLSQYRRTDRALSRKYGVSFDEFVNQRMTRQFGYRWEVEQDAMSWETAVGGIMTIERKLQITQEVQLL